MKDQSILRRAVLHLLNRENQLQAVDGGDRDAYCLMLRVLDLLAR